MVESMNVSSFQCSGFGQKIGVNSRNWRQCFRVSVFKRPRQLAGSRQRLCFSAPLRLEILV
jgi:hypothetical protein